MKWFKAHNHPSGNFDASDADRFITQKIKQAAELFDILVIDHLIMTDESFLSFSEEGLLF